MEDIAGDSLVNLKPLRDLARNWDIDIASCLQDYLKDLVRVGHPMPCTSNAITNSNSNEGSTNFAQAALLLQNSSSVYSRKVEYLYSLVYAAMSELTVSSRHGHGDTVKKMSGKSKFTKELHEFEAFDPDLDFLLLNNVLPMDNGEGKIDLDVVEGNDRVSMGGIETAASLFNREVNATHLSIGMSGTFVEQSTADKSISIISPAAAQAILSTLVNEGTEKNGGNLRLLNGMCDVDAHGILLMPGSSVLNSKNYGYDNNMDNGTSFNDTLDIPAIGINLGDDMEEDSGFINNDAGDDEINNDEQDNEGITFELNDGKKEALYEKNFVKCQNKATAETVDTQKKVSDPWLMLDPHDSGVSKNRPLRTKVTYRLPSGIFHPPSSCVTGARTKKKSDASRDISLKDNLTCFSAAQSFAVTTSIAEENRRNHQLFEEDEIESTTMEVEGETVLDYNVAVPFSIAKLVYGDEFKYIAKAETKRKEIEKRQLQKNRIRNSLLPAGSAMNLPLNDLYHKDCDNDDDIGVDFADDEHDDFEGESSVQCNSNMGIHFDDIFAGESEHVNSNDENSEDGLKAFEDLCRAHLKEFAKGAAKYSVETQLSKRVAVWQRRLAPILDDEVDRRDFDIYKYEENVLKSVESEIEEKQQNNNKDSLIPSNILFSSITKKHQPYEVCRIFLTSLMLCNSEDIRLVQDDFSEVASPESLLIEMVEKK